MKQKINIRLSLIALIAIITTTVGITSVYYNLFQRQVRNDLQSYSRMLIHSEKRVQKILRTSAREI